MDRNYQVTPAFALLSLALIPMRKVVENAFLGIALMPVRYDLDVQYDVPSVPTPIPLPPQIFTIQPPPFTESEPPTPTLSNAFADFNSSPVDSSAAQNPIHFNGAFNNLFPPSRYLADILIVLGLVTLNYAISLVFSHARRLRRKDQELVQLFRLTQDHAKEIAQLKRDNEAQLNMSRLENDEATKRARDAQKRTREAAEKYIDQLVALLDESNDKKEEAERRRAESEIIVEQLVARNDELNAEKEEVERKMEEAERKMEEAVSKYEEAERSKEEAEKQKEEAEKKKEEAEKKRGEAERQTDALQKVLTERDMLNLKLKETLSVLSPKAKKLEQELDWATQRYQQLEGTLKTTLISLEAEKAETESLKQKDTALKGRAAFTRWRYAISCVKKDRKLEKLWADMAALIPLPADDDDHAKSDHRGTGGDGGDGGEGDDGSSDGGSSGGGDDGGDGGDDAGGSAAPPKRSRRRGHHKKSSLRRKERAERKAQALAVLAEEKAAEEKAAEEKAAEEKALAALAEEQALAAAAEERSGRVNLT